MDRPPLPDRVAELETRVAFLEAVLQARHPAAAPQASDAREIEEPATESGPTPADKTSWELQMGLTWLNRGGAAAVVVALVFAALWAHDHGLLSPLLRTLLAMGAALGALIAGLRMSASKTAGVRVFAYGFQAIGALGLYVLCFSAAHIDELVSSGQAMALACLNTIALTALAQRLNLNALANLAALGGLSVPMLSHSEHPHFAPIFVFLSAQALLHSWLARKQHWGQVALIQALGLSLYFLYLASNADELHGLGQGVAMTLVLGLFVCLYVRDELFSAGARETDRLAAWLALFAALGCWWLIESDTSRLSPILVSLLAGGGLAALAVFMHRRRLHPRTSGPALMGALALLVSGLAADAPWQLIALASPASLLLLSLLREDEPVWLSLRALSLLMIPAVSFALCDHALDTADARAGLLALALGLQFPLWRPRPEADAPRLHAVAVFSSHSLGAVALALWLSQGSLLQQASGQWVAVSVAPALYGLGLLSLGRRWGDPWTRYTGLALAGLCALKVVLLDVWSLSAGARVSVFLSLGLLLLGGSYLYSRSDDARA